MGSPEGKDEIRTRNVKLKQYNGWVVLDDPGTYHIGDNTVAQIINFYNRGKWYDFNPPSLWEELWGAKLRLPLDYPPKSEIETIQQ
jgi:hypothetical protein